MDQAMREGFQEYQAIPTLLTPCFLLSLSFQKREGGKTHRLPTPRPLGKCPVPPFTGGPVSGQLLQPPDGPSTISAFTQYHLLSIDYLQALGSTLDAH